MNNNDTTIKAGNLIAVVQHDLDAAWSLLEQARDAYRADHSDENLARLEAARMKYLRVEAETRRAGQVLAGRVR